MREKYDGLKKLIIICTMVLVIVGLFPAGINTANMPGMTVWARTENVIEETRETKEPETEEPETEEPEAEALETKESEVEEPETEEPEPQSEPQPEPQPATPKQRWEYTEAELIQIALAEAGVSGDMSAWDKAVAVNNYLCNLVTYDDTHTYRSTFDTLAYGTAVCQGWTGVEWGSHGWNRVFIDGTYYYVDVTWNDCLSSDQYLLISYEQMSYDHYQQRLNPYRVE